MVMDLEHIVVKRLRSMNRTLATAESCTGGLIAHRITNVSGASEVFLGGVVAYSNTLKVQLLGVSEASLAQFGAVSEQVAREMSRGICERTGSDLGIGVTGIAGPTGGTESKPVGLVYISVASCDLNVWNCIECRFSGSREEIKYQTSERALQLVLEAIEQLR